MEKDYEWQRKNHSDLKKSGSKIANSKILSGIRTNRMKKLNAKIRRTKDSIKEDYDIVNELNKYEQTAKQKAKNIARAKKYMEKAKNNAKSANKEWGKAMDEYGKGPLIGFTKKQRQKNSELYKNVMDKASKSDRADEEYKRAKNAYKNSRR